MEEEILAITQKLNSCGIAYSFNTGVPAPTIHNIQALGCYLTLNDKFITLNALYFAVIKCLDGFEVEINPIEDKQAVSIVPKSELSTRR